MSEIKNLRHFARFYFLNNEGRLVTRDMEVYTSNICLIRIPDECMFVEVFSVDKNASEVNSSVSLNMEGYLIGKRFDRSRSSFKSDAEKFSFVMQKVYKPHIELDEKKIKNGIYTVQSEEEDQA